MQLVLKVGVYVAIMLGFPCVGWSMGDDTSTTLIKQVDYLQNKHEVMAQNVANVSTPKYITQDIERPELIDSHGKKLRVKKVRMALTNSRHILGKEKNKQYNVFLDKSSPMKPNKNNVDLSTQVTKMAQNHDEALQALKNYRSAMDLVGIASGSGGGSQ
jgi:flagellar basal-body rod protein FlgB